MISKHLSVTRLISIRDSASLVPSWNSTTFGEISLSYMNTIWIKGEVGAVKLVLALYWPFQGSTSLADHLCFCYAFVRVCLFVPGHLLGKGGPLASRLWCLWVCHFPIGILGQVWYLIVSIADLWILTYLLVKYNFSIILRLCYFYYFLCCELRLCRKLECINIKRQRVTWMRNSTVLYPLVKALQMLSPWSEDVHVIFVRFLFAFCYFSCFLNFDISTYPFWDSFNDI